MLCADDFTCSAYGYGEASDYIFYSDEEHTRQIDINNFEVVWGSAFIGIYVADAD